MLHPLIDISDTGIVPVAMWRTVWPPVVVVSGGMEVTWLSDCVRAVHASLSAFGSSSPSCA